MIKLKKIKEKINPVNNGSTFISGIYNDLNEFSSYLNDISSKIEDKNNVKYPNYNKKRVSKLKKPSLNNIINYSKNEENIDSLEEILDEKKSDEFMSNLRKRVKEEFNLISEIIKKDYLISLNQDNFYASVDIIYNDLYFENIRSIENYGLLLDFKSSDNIDKLILLENGNKKVYKDNYSIVFKNKTDLGLIDLMEKGIWIEDETSEEDNNSKYRLKKDYSLR